mgnify:CR=1 FL=1
MSKELCTRITDARHRTGMSQSELSRKIGVTKSAVSQWELGATKDIKCRFFFPLAEALKIDPQKLFYGDSSVDINATTP